MRCLRSAITADNTNMQSLDAMGTCVPLLIRTHELAQPSVATDALVEMVDLCPSLAALAGLDVPTEFDGRSFTPLLKDPHAPGRDVVSGQFNRLWDTTTPEMIFRSVHRRDCLGYKLVCWRSGAVGFS